MIKMFLVATTLSLVSLSPVFCMDASPEMPRGIIRQNMAEYFYKQGVMHCRKSEHDEAIKNFKKAVKHGVQQGEEVNVVFFTNIQGMSAASKALGILESIYGIMYYNTKYQSPELKIILPQSFKDNREAS